MYDSPFSVVLQKMMGMRQIPPLTAWSYVTLPKVLEPGDYTIIEAHQTQELVDLSKQYRLYFFVSYSDKQKDD
jgi:hypothetical protein